MFTYDAVESNVRLIRMGTFNRVITFGLFGSGILQGLKR